MPLRCTECGSGRYDGHDMPPNTPKHLRLVEACQNQESTVHRTAERRAADRAKGDEVERIAAVFCMRHGLSVQKITAWDFDLPAYPAGFFDYENDDAGEGWNHFVAFDLLVRGRTSFIAEVKLKAVRGHGSRQHYLLDCIRLSRMAKAYRNASDLQHLFVVYDPIRKEASADGFFAVTMDQLIANRSNYGKQSGFQNGQNAYRIPISEFRPLTHFLKQHSPLTETSNADQSNPFPFPDEAAGESHHCGRTAAA